MPVGRGAAAGPGKAGKIWKTLWFVLTVAKQNLVELLMYIYIYYYIHMLGNTWDVVR